MTNKAEKYGFSRADINLRNAVMTTSLSGLVLSLIGTFFIWAGVNAFNCPEIIWKASLSLNLTFFLLTWLIYPSFRNTNKLIGKGLLACLTLISFFWLFGFAMFYFYFLFAPINPWARALALISLTTVLTHRALLINKDIKSAFEKNGDLLQKIYRNESDSIYFDKDAISNLQKFRRDRNPFNSVYLYGALLISPIALILNRLTSPIIGDGHGVFLVVAFLSTPILQWGVEIFVQILVTMIYLPIKLQRQTGKPVLSRD